MNALKTFLAANGYDIEGKSDAEIKELATQAIKDGKLSVDKYTELLATKSAKDELAELLDDSSQKTADRVVEGLGNHFEKLTEAIVGKPADVDDGKLSEIDKIKAELQKNMDAAEKRILAGKGTDSAPVDGSPDPHKVFGDVANDDSNIRVKKASESYSSTKTALAWGHRRSQIDNTISGQPFKHSVRMGTEQSAREVGYDESSELEFAKMGVFLKSRLLKFHRNPNAELNEHDQQLLAECLHEDKWVGFDESPYGKKLPDWGRKAVLDESGTSGGASAVPEFFDFNAIQTPLLHSELLPFVEVVRVPRGSSADSYTIGTPTTVTTASGSAITPFSTSSFVSGFDTTFYPMSVAFEFGNDFLNDAAPDFGRRVMDQIGQEYLRKLDENIAIGDGTTEIQGLFIGSTTAVAAEAGTFSSFTYNEILNLAFGIDKAHRNAFGGMGTRFVMNDAQYKELMQIATGVTGDTRPIFGMGIKDYMLGDYPVAIQNNITNGNLALANLRGYRLYWRQGMEFVEDNGGRTSRLADTTLVLGRARHGGQMTLSTYVAEMSP